jgi:adenylate kinase family enzyme
MTSPPKTLSRRRIFLVGIPGAGKTTLGLALQSTLGAGYISSGSLLKRSQDTGRFSDGAMPDPRLIVDLVATELGRADLPTPVIVDGFPRTWSQCDLLLGSRIVNLDDLVIVVVTVPAEVALHRLRWRRTCSRCGCPATRPDGAATCPACHGPLVHREDDADRHAVSRVQAHARHLRLLLERLTHPEAVCAVDGRREPADNIVAIMDFARSRR